MARVLVVDDERSIRVTLGQFLKQAGHDVETAEDADAATSLMKGTDFDVVVTDIVLPRVSGVALLQAIHAADPDLPVIMMTGEPTVETAVEAVRAGAHDYLRKPITKNLVILAVEKAARWKALLDDRKRLEIANREYQQTLEVQNQALLRARRDLQGLNEELEQRVSQRTAALEQEQADRLELEHELRQAQKMEAVGQLAGGVAHDFNNALMPMMVYSGLLLDRLDPQAPLRHYAERIAIAAESASNLPRQLLAFSRKQVLQPEVMNLNEVVGGIAKMLRHVLGELIEIVTHLSPTLDAVEADPGQIEQVLMNLAVNARDAMPRGGTLTIETTNTVLGEEHGRLYPKATPGRYVMLVVSDTGCGMDKETQERIFEPFFTTKDEGKGTGLGLSTVYGIVRQSGGQVQAASKVGHGSTFRICLPAVADRVGAADSVVAAVAQGGSETILVAEDEEFVRQGVSDMLQAYGYTVLTASDGEEALRAAEKHPGIIHILLTDLVMPAMGGRQLAERLVAQRPEMKVIYMSGYTEDAAIQQGVLDAAIQFLQKPFTAGVLTRKVREVLGGGF